MGVCCVSGRCGTVFAFLLNMIVTVGCGYSVYEVYRRDNNGQFLQSVETFRHSLQTEPYYAAQFLLLILFTILGALLCVLLLSGVCRRRTGQLLTWTLLWLLIVLWVAAYTAIQLYEMYRKYGPAGKTVPEGEDFWLATAHIGASFFILLLNVWALLGVCSYRKELNEGRHEEYQQVSTG